MNLAKMVLSQGSSLLLGLGLFSQNALASLQFLDLPLRPVVMETICGTENDRILSYDRFIARGLKSRGDSAGCTATLINDTCMVSAGHCFEYLNVLEFNVPQTINNISKHPEPQDIYQSVPGSLVYKNLGPGNDWAVFRVKPNTVTGLLPGQAQGGHYKVNLTLVPDYGAELRVTGYGKDSDPDRNFSQQTHSGDHAGVFGDSELRHRIDTMGGNSGSTIINEATQEIIGIHTHGGCSTAEDSANAGTSLAKNQEFVNAVKACLALTKKEDLQ